jgi:hypothetical protein
MKQAYEKPELIEYGNLKQVTGGLPATSVPVIPPK